MPTVSKSPTRGVAIPSTDKRRELVKKIETSASFSQQKRRKAARKRVFRVIKQQILLAKHRSFRAVSMTLTYKNNADFAPRNISDFLAKVRQMLKRKGYAFQYVWTLEQAEQLHYHLLLWLPRTLKLDLNKLVKQWCWGTTWLEYSKSPSAWGRYIAKFKNITPLMRGARIYGYGGMDAEARLAIARAGMPLWLLAVLPVGHSARRCPGGGWVNSATGEFHPSPYIWTPRGTVLRS